MEFSFTQKTLFNVSAIAILSMILLSGALAFSGNTFASNSATGSPTTLPNAAGYEVSGPAGSFTRVRGSWIVPTVSCGSVANSQSNVSVVLDGLPGSTDGMYVGTFANCVNGKAQYGAFTYFRPASHHGLTLLGLVIKPGDVISAQGKWDAKTHGWHSQINDTTTHTSAQSNAKAPKTFGNATLTKAAFLVGMPSHTMLSDFGKLNLGSNYTNVKDTCIVSVGGLGKDTTLGALALSSPYTVTMITQQDSKANTMALPSALSSDGGSFTVTWMAYS